ncbi:MAG: MYG1 family protein [Clostridia bacterium]|nr:MYG1 family protein [Clostridia bacterium]
MIINITKNVKHANAITHGGKFHADDVLATVILGKFFSKVTVYRTFKVPDDIDEKVIVYDIGYGKFDHHQNGGNGRRLNGVPYAACGLIWREFGPKVVENTCNPQMVWNIIDRELIQGVDATDNGEMPNVDYSCHNMSFTTMISMFNPNWEDDVDFDPNFIKAVSFAETVFDNMMAYAIAKAKAKEYVEEAIEKAEGHIMILNQYLPWQSYVLSSQNEKAKEILFVVYPSKRGGYNFQGVPETFNSFRQRKSVPVEWRGKSDEEFQRLTGICTARFCHPAGFVGGAVSLDDTIALARLAVEK